MRLGNNVKSKIGLMMHLPESMEYKFDDNFLANFQTKQNSDRSILNFNFVHCDNKLG